MSQQTTGPLASATGQGEMEAAKEVLATAGHEASALASEAAEQARDLLQAAKEQVRETTIQERDRFSRVLEEFTTELSSMRNAGTGGYATQLADMVLQRARALQSAIRDTEPEQMLGGVQDYARRSPGMFLSGAAALGFALGRMTRSAATGQASGSASLTSTPRPPQRISSIVGEASTATMTEPYLSSYSDEEYLDESEDGISRGA